MADDKKTPGNADFIKRVVGDPANPPETRVLSGWFGDAAEEGYRRLYSDAELSSYVDIPEDAILHTEPIRDSQPAGAVLVWVKRDAVLKPGGSAASRAARFLQGDVQRDFSTPEKAGFRCATQVPCGEPTGFTGKCTNEPQVGGAWPCITAIPHCAEPTGFTGKCTHQPWPNPTRYVGCTIFHCPTHDLTHIPHICNLVAQEGAAEPQAAAEGAAPATKLPGCGYTKTWGLCEADGGAGNFAAFGAAAPAPIPQTMSPTLFVCCQPSLVGHGCTNIGPACPPTPATICTQNGPDCQTHVAPNCPTHNPCCTHNGPHCPPTPGIICTQFGPQCPKETNPLLDCTFGCTQFGPACPNTAAVQCAAQQQADPAARFGARIGALAQGHGGVGPQLTDILCPTVTIAEIRCFVTAPPTFSDIECVTQPIQCSRTKFCPTPFCPPPTPLCFTPACPTHHHPCPSVFVACTFAGPQCPGQVFDPGRIAAFAAPAAAAAVQVSQTCQLATPLCPPQTHVMWCPPSPFFHCPPSPFVYCPPSPYFHCPPSPYFHCPPITQVIVCNPSVVDACPTRLCPAGGGGVNQG
jgi:hypothetical protein